jgi:hypothetical protein
VGCRIRTVENVRREFVHEGFEPALARKKRMTSPTPKLLDGAPRGNDRLKRTHLYRLKRSRLVLQDSRSGQERQPLFHADFRPFLDFIDSRKR